MSQNEYDNEPIPGLPELLPDGEHLIWQGSPDGSSAARRALYGNLVALYFAILTAGMAISAVQNGASVTGAISASWHLLVIGAAGAAIVALLGSLVHRTTIYTITNKRVVMRYGMALPMVLNLPFHKIASADVKLYRDGTGDIALNPADSLPLTYLHLWPHARGFYLRAPQPALRCVPDAEDVAASLVRAMLAEGVISDTALRSKSQALRPSVNAEPSGAAIPA